MFDLFLSFISSLLLVLLVLAIFLWIVGGVVRFMVLGGFGEVYVPRTTPLLAALMWPFDLWVTWRDWK